MQQEMWSVICSPILNTDTFIVVYFTCGDGFDHWFVLLFITWTPVSAACVIVLQICAGCGLWAVWSSHVWPTQRQDDWNQKCRPHRLRQLCPVCGFIFIIIIRFNSVLRLTVMFHKSFYILIGGCYVWCCASMVCAIAMSLCVYVYLSVTRRYCVKMAKHRIAQTVPHDSPGTLVFWYRKSWLYLNRVPVTGGNKCKWGSLKLAIFNKYLTVTRKQCKIDS